MPLGHSGHNLHCFVQLKLKLLYSHVSLTQHSIIPLQFSNTATALITAPPCARDTFPLTDKLLIISVTVSGTSARRPDRVVEYVSEGARRCSERVKEIRSVTSRSPAGRAEYYVRLALLFFFFVFLKTTHCDVVVNKPMSCFPIPLMI